MRINNITIIIVCSFVLLAEPVIGIIEIRHGRPPALVTLGMSLRAHRTTCRPPPPPARSRHFSTPFPPRNHDGRLKTRGRRVAYAQTNNADGKQKHEEERKKKKKAKR